MNLEITAEFEQPEIVREKSGTGKNGQPYSFREQRCTMHGVGRFPVDMFVKVPDGAKPFAFGKYEVHDLIVIGKYGFEISRDFFLTLLAVKKPA